MKREQKNRVFSFAFLKKHLDTGKIVPWKYSWNLSRSGTFVSDFSENFSTKSSMVVGGLITHQKYKTQQQQRMQHQQRLDLTLEAPHNPFLAASAPSIMDIDREQVSPNSFSSLYPSIPNRQEPDTEMNEDSPPLYSIYLHPDTMTSC